MYENENYLEDGFDTNEALAKWIDMNDNLSLDEEDEVEEDLEEKTDHLNKKQRIGPELTSD